MIKLCQNPYGGNKPISQVSHAVQSHNLFLLSIDTIFVIKWVSETISSEREINDIYCGAFFFQEVINFMVVSCV